VLTRGCLQLGAEDAKFQCVMMVFPKYIYNYPYIQPVDGQISLQPMKYIVVSNSLEPEADQL